MMKISKLKMQRYEKTLRFMDKHLPKGSRILDLGTANPLSKIMEERGYQVRNTGGENLDDDYLKYANLDVDAVTSFEIFEHMLAPYNILKELKTKKLIASIPLKLWFASAYWNDKDDWDKHYHEFERKQFNFLLEKTGWTIKDSETWTSASWKKIGFRPILRHFTPRYYIVYCEKNS